jgi:hypothetical protein
MVEVFMKSGAFLWCCLLIFAMAVVVFSAEVYVSPTGNDAAAGTITAPLATLTAARDKADQLKANNTPVMVYLRGGTYYLSTPLVFGAANSGTATAPIVYTSYPKEKPVISGGIKVTSAWAASSGSIMVTTIAPNLNVDQLFLNGKRQVLARYPNFDSTQRLDGSAADCIGATRVQRWANPGEGPGYIRALHSAEWGGNDYRMTGKTGTTINYTWVGDNNRGSQMHATYRMVENLFEELDAAGEWFYRKSTGQLFFWPPAGTNLGTSTIELATLEELVRFVGTSSTTANCARYIQFKGITFTQTYRTLFGSKPFETILKSDWAIVRAGTVFMRFAENIRIENCLFDQIGGNGVFMSGYNRNHVIYNDTFNYGGATAVAMVGDTSSVRCPSSWGNTPTCNDRNPGPKTPDYPAIITVFNNMINHSGRFEKQSAGIDLSMTMYDTVRHNTVHDCPRACINFTDGCWGGSIIEYNWVYNSVMETGDHGPFNAWGRDRNGRWPNDTSATTLDAWKTTIIRNNRFEAKQGNFGIDLDDQASNYLQYNNLLFGGGLKLQWHRYNTYLNNILVSGADVQIHGVWGGGQEYVARNIMTTSRPYYIGFFNVTSANQNVDSVWRNVRMIDSNCIGSNPSVGSDRGTPLWSYWTSRGFDVHSVITADPMFTNTATGDYSLKANSPCLACGFKNFPMDSFGVMKYSDAVSKPSVMSAKNETGNAAFYVNYRAGRLTVSHNGDYQLTVTTAQGRTVKIFNGKDRLSFDLNTNVMGAGVYFAVIRGKNGMARQKFLVE